MSIRKVLFPLALFMVLAGCGGSTSDHDVPKPEVPEVSEMYVDKEMLFALSDSLYKRFEKDGLSALSGPEQVFLLVWSIDSEVHSGGFASFFFNSFGDYAIETVGALEVIGGTSTADLVRQANVVFGPYGPSADIDERQSQVDALPASAKAVFDGLDNRFYEYKENLGVLLSQYVQEHPRDFQTP